ncbi:hypothetical protein CDAR_405401 [Caerostris darwini]|uniref:Uncharacterized protein n=1 Tax=Caerostris darwini TaxID=1538125 RepID=A0AAV4WEY4_9ARAC|nr:hypothetical protein CDAR_405401 [Caerostris darwini]
MNNLVLSTIRGRYDILVSVCLQIKDFRSYAIIVERYFGKVRSSEKSDDSRLEADSLSKCRSLQLYKKPAKRSQRLMKAPKTLTCLHR